MANMVKVRLAQLGKKQVDLLVALRERGFINLSPALLSTYVNGMSMAPQAQAVVKASDKILGEWEREQEG